MVGLPGPPSKQKPAASVLKNLLVPGGEWEPGTNGTNCTTYLHLFKGSFKGERSRFISDDSIFYIDVIRILMLMT